ncbi:MAG: diacylglycerol kinase [Capsulimonadales bacterium]|nr:diacylglycerol kinase [Capsulimonadales bacterium]
MSVLQSGRDSSGESTSDEHSPSPESLNPRRSVGTVLPSSTARPSAPYRPTPTTPRVLPTVSPWRPRNPFHSFRHAAEGVLHTFRTQRNMRFHIAICSLVLLSGLIFRLERLEMAALLVVCSLVIMAELFNTAVEVVVDMITESYHPGAKIAKDAAAGGVLVASLNSVMVGGVLFLWNGRIEQLRLRLQQPPSFYLFMTGFLLLMIVLMALKIRGEKGTLLQGGVVSGHTAVAFFLATSIIIVVGNVYASVLAILLALLVAQSRVEARIHTVREVVLGAALAIFLTVCAYQLPVWFGQLIPVPG